MTSETISSHLSSFWRGRVLFDCSMAQFCTLRVGGPAEALVYAEATGDLVELVSNLNREGIEWRVIGRGSNLLVTDQGLSGVTIILAGQFGAISRPAAGADALLTAGASCMLPALVARCCKEGLAGLEFAAGIPGTVGGAVVMNAGAWGGEVKDVLHSVRLMRRDGTLLEKKRDELAFSYRKLRLDGPHLVLDATFGLAPDEPRRIKARCDQLLVQRRSRQPQGVASAGSFFKNPLPRAAGQLIDEAGLKGLRVGGAMVSEKHANFIVNTGTATARDILDLMAVVQEKVLHRSGILLEPEVQILGNH